MRDPCEGDGSTHFLACNCRERQFEVTKKQLEAAIDLIRQLEWNNDKDFTQKYCHICFYARKQGHAPYCKIQEFFKMIEAHHGL